MRKWIAATVAALFVAWLVINAPGAHADNSGPRQVRASCSSSGAGGLRDIQLTFRYMFDDGDPYYTIEPITDLGTGRFWSIEVANFSSSQQDLTAMWWHDPQGISNEHVNSIYGTTYATRWATLPPTPVPGHFTYARYVADNERNGASEWDSDRQWLRWTNGSLFTPYAFRTQDIHNGFGWLLPFHPYQGQPEWTVYGRRHNSVQWSCTVVPHPDTDPRPA